MVFIHLAEGFEEIEAITIADILRRGDVEVSLVSVTDKIEVVGSHGIKIIADSTIESIGYEQCQVIVLPGGMPGTFNLTKSSYLMDRIMEFNSKEKLICAICAAPLVLEKVGILKNINATIYRGMENYIESANYNDEKVVKDKNIITSQGPGTAMVFALEILKELKGNIVYEKVKKDLLI